MAFKRKLCWLTFFCLLGAQLKITLLADETRYYVVLVNGEPRQAEVIISHFDESHGSGRVITHVQGMESFTYSYSRLPDTTTGYILTIEDPNPSGDNSVLVSGIAANYDHYFEDYPDDLYFWLEDSPAISPDGSTLQLPVIFIQSFYLQSPDSVLSDRFRGHHYSAPNADSASIELLTDNDFQLVQTSLPDFRMTRIHPPKIRTELSEPLSEKQETSDTDSDSSLDSDSGSEELVTNFCKFNLDKGKKNRKDDDDPDAPGPSTCPSNSYQQVTLVPVRAHYTQPFRPEMIKVKKTDSWLIQKDPGIASDNWYQYFLRQILITLLVKELKIF